MSIPESVISAFLYNVNFLISSARSAQPLFAHKCEKRPNFGLRVFGCIAAIELICLFFAATLTDYIYSAGATRCFWRSSRVCE